MRTEPTRELTCQDCPTVFIHVGRRPAIRCPACRTAWAALRSKLHAVKSGRVKNPGVGSGGAQLGKTNSQWKGGIVAYRKYAREGELVCALRGAAKGSSELCAHHIDHNRKNNRRTNLQLLCKACHQNVAHPTPRDAEGKYTAETKLQKNTGTPGRGQSDLKASDNTIVRGND